jgi:bile acid-coenzyme A ligase
VQGEITVMTDDGRVAAPGAVGEVWMRHAGPGRTYRYIGAQPTVRGGWQTHGDRTSNMVLVGGVNVYPAETEAAILLYPGVLSCAVVGLPDEDLGQRLHAVVQADRPIDSAQLIEFLRAQLLPVKVPRSVRFVTEALRDDAGKVRRAQLREQELAHVTAASAG